MKTPIGADFNLAGSSNAMDRNHIHQHILFLQGVVTIGAMIFKNCHQVEIDEYLP
ncbi:hypothetical protein CRD_02714 [Raphidiopsis brookii D9]|nr:hypothetical protein CRD_02714 [Raphidiopsis brookii D9]